MSTEYVDAIEYFEENIDASFNNNYDNDGAISAILELQEDFRCRVQIALHNEEYESELFINLPEVIDPGLIVAIASLRPSEISEEQPRLLRLWWD